MPSLQLTHYLRLRGSGASVEQASAQSGIPVPEAVLHEQSVRDGELSFIKGETRMARADNDQVKEVHAPDFDRMKRIFLHDLKPAEERNAKSRGDLSAAWGTIEKDCHVNKRAAKLLFRLHNESEEARDDFLRSLYGGMKVLGIGISRDLVDRMTDADAPEMPIVETGGLGEDNLATLTPRPDADAAAFDNDAESTLPAA